MICGIGLTVIVNSIGGPGQLAAVFVKYGITVIVAISGWLPVFNTVKEGMLPKPFVDNPIPGLSLVHE